MSKVIKSSSVNIQSPTIIRIAEPEIIPVETEQDVPAEVIEVIEVSDNSEELERVNEQASQILKETEQMVRELLETAREEAGKIIKSANDEAERIMASGRERVKEVHDEAYDKGQKQGYEDGLTMASMDCEAKLAEAARELERARQERREIIEGSETEVIQIAMAVARKIISEEIILNSECIVEIVKRAVLKATDREELTVRVSPVNLDETLAAQDEIIHSTNGIRKLKVTADPAITPGGCVVESPNGTVDARIESQLDEIEQALMEVSP